MHVRGFLRTFLAGSHWRLVVGATLFASLTMSGCRGAGDSLDESLAVNVNTVTVTSVVDSEFGNASLAITPTQYDFGQVSVGSTPRSVLANLKNVSRGTVYINSITGDSSPHFQVASTTCPALNVGLAPGASCSAILRFQPQAGGSHQFTFTALFGNSPSNTILTQSVTIVGTGVAILNFGGLNPINPAQVSTTKATLAWTGVSGASSYVVYKAVTGNALAIDGYAASGATGYLVENLDPNTSYTFRVNALNTLGAPDTNNRTQVTTTDPLGTFTAISAISASEGTTVTSGDIGLNCTDIENNYPQSMLITSQSDSASQCTLLTSPYRIQCNPLYKTGHSDWNSTLSIACYLNDYGTAYTRNVTVNVSDLNRAPVLAAIGNQNVVTGNLMTVTPSGSDADGDTLTYSCTYDTSVNGSVAGGAPLCSSLLNQDTSSASFSTSTGVFSWTPALSYSGQTFEIKLSVTDGNGGTVSRIYTIAATQPLIDPSRALISLSSGTVASGSTITVTLQAKESHGYSIPFGGETVLFSRSGGTSTGTFSGVTDNSNGTYTATFTGVLAGTATTIGGTVGGAAVTSALSTVVVTHGPASQLVFVQQPTSADAGVSIAPAITTQFKDAAGNIVTTGAGSTANVTMSLFTGPGVLSGTLTKAAVAGVATFNDLKVNRIATGDRLTASGASLSVVSSTFDVTGQAFSSTLSFANGTGYTYDNSVIDFTGSLAQLSALSFGDSTSGNFAAGNHTGTAYDSNGFLRLDQSGTPTNNSELDQGWTPQYSSVVAYWKMNGNFNDSKGTNNGSAQNGASFSTLAKIGSQAGQFSPNAYVSVPDSASLKPTSQITMAGWMYPSTFSGNTWMLSKNIFGGSPSGYGIAFENSTGKIWPHITVGGSLFNPKSSQGISTGRWTHIVVTYDGSNVKMYMDGELISTAGASGTLTQGSSNLTLGALPSPNEFFNGNLDDIAIWNTALTAADVQTLYSRQSPRYSGTFLSRVFDAGTSVNWTGFNWKTTLPFFKELPSTSETSSQYSDQSSSMMNGIVGLWHLDESTGGASSIIDRSGNGFNGSTSGTLTHGNSGRLGTAPKFTSGAIDVGNPTALRLNTGTLSAWVNTSNAGASFRAIVVKEGAYGIFALNNNLALYDWGGSIIRSTSIALNDAQWHHVALTFDSGVTDSTVFYIDGRVATVGGNSTTTMTVADQGTNVWFGSAPYSGQNFSGLIDEVGIWNRVLAPSEILAVYRRGANRVLFQARGCTAANCTDDPAWVGADGTNQSYFNELYNATNNAYLGAPLANAPGMLFSNFGISLNKRYIQYRAILESSDTGTSCSGAWCSPNIQSVTLTGPTAYSNSAPTISSNTGIDFSGLTSLTEILGGNGCSGTPKFLLSLDSTNWYYWSGAAWGASNGSLAQANTEAEVIANIASLPTQVPAGNNLYIRVFLNSSGATPCELTGLAVAGIRTYGGAIGTAISSLAWNPAPSKSVGSGVVIPAFKVALLDSNGNVITSNNSTTITLDRTQGSGTLGGTLTQTVANGVATFNDITYTKAETITLQATENTNNTTVSRPFIIVAPGPIAPAQSLITVSSSTVNSGNNVTLTLQARDSNGNNITTGGQTVVFGHSGGTSTGDISGTTDVGNGTYTAVFTGRLAGSATTITATVNGTAVTTTLPTITVSPGAINLANSTFTINSGSSASLVAGTTATLRLTLKDFGGNQILDNAQAGNLSFTVLSTGTSSGTIGSIAGVIGNAGVYEAVLTATTAGTANTLRATITELGNVTASPSFTTTFSAVNAGTSTLASSPASVTADGSTTSTITVTLKDAYSNPVSGKNVSLASNRGSNDTISAASGASNSSGIVTFTVKSTLAGIATFNATNTSDSLAINQTAGVTFTAGPVSPTVSTLAAVPATGVVANNISTSTVTVTLLDVNSNPVSGKTVSIASNRSSSDTISPATVVTNTSGQAAFTVKSTASGTSTYTATDITDSNMVISPNTATVGYIAGPATSIAIYDGNTQTKTVATALDNPIRVVVKDQYLNVVPSVSVAWAVTSGGGSVSASTSTTNSSGIAAITWTLGNTAGSNAATATINGQTASFSATGVAGPATQLAFVQNPSNTAAFALIAPAVTVAVKDALNNTVLTDNSSEIQIALTTGPGTLSGILTKTAASGIAIFSDLSINTSANGDVLTASRSGLTSATSSAFNILPQPFSSTLSFNSSTSSGYTTSGALDFTSSFAESTPITSSDTSQANFDAGVHTGTVYDNTNGILRLDQSGTPTNNAELDASWTPQYSGIVGYWKLNNNTIGSIASGATITATVGANATAGTAGTSYVAGKLGQGIYFPGSSNDNANAPSSGSMDLTGDFSVAFWINPTTITGTVFYPIGKSAWSVGYSGQSTFCGAAGLFYLYPEAGMPSPCSTVPLKVGVWQHVLVTYSSSGAIVNLFLNGTNVGSGALSTPITHYAGRPFYIGVKDAAISGSPILSWPANASVDEVALWNTALSASQVETIYSRQSAKYSGTFLSRVFNAGSASTWTGLNWTSTLPFMKELAGGAASEASGYSGFGGSNLMSGNVGLWQFSEAAPGTAPSGTDFADKSGNSLNGTRTGTGVTLGSAGVFGNSIKLNGTHYVTVPNNALLNAYPITVSAWFSTTLASGNAGLVVKYASGSSNGHLLRIVNGDVCAAYFGNSSNKVPGDGNSCFGRASGYNDGRWHFAAFTVDSAGGNLYVDGVKKAGPIAWTGSPTAPTSNDVLRIGAYDNLFSGSLDEVGLWNRALSASEVIQLYRRGANRVKYQIRTCASANCADNPTWKGPDDSNQTYFTELNNNSNVYGTGNVLATSPSFLFSAFSTAPAVTIQNTQRQYAQYRAILESDDTSTSCSGTWCSPDVKTVSLSGPATGYIVGSSSLTTNTPINFIGLTSLTEVLGGGGCSGVPKYMLSPNSTAWYGWGGSAWSNLGVGNYATANTELEITSNLSTYAAQVGGSSVYIKVFLNTDGTAPCELAALAISGSRSPSSAPNSTVSALAWNPAPVRSAVAGAAMTTFKVQVVDSSGNVVTTDNASQVTLSRTTGSGTLGGTLTRTVSAGVATFDDVTYTKAETFTLRATVNSVTLDRAGIVVSPAVFSLAQSVVSGPSSFNQTIPVAVTLTAKDQFQNANPTGITSVVFTNSGVAGSFSTVVHSGNGVYTANFTPSATGTVTIGATINGGTVSPNTLTVPVNGPPTQIAVSSGNSQTGTVATALSSPFVAIVRDASNVIVPSAPVNWAVTAGAGSLSSASNVTNASGLSSSTLTLGTTAGTNTVTATVAGTAISTSFSASATAGAATQLAFVQNPSTTVAYSYITPSVTVEVRDTYGNKVLTDSTSSIAMTLTTGTGTLGGTTPKTASSGTATFSDLTVSASGSGKILTASRSGLTSATSSAFTITDQPFSTTLSFNSSTSSGYGYDNSVIDFTSSLVELTPLAFRDSTSSDFASGSHTGTTYDGTNGFVRLDQAGTPTNTAELDASWTPQWGNLIGYWKLNEIGAGTVSGGKDFADSSPVGTNHGTTFGGVTYGSSGRLYKAPSFNGSTGYIDTPVLTTATTNITMSAWFRTNNYQQPGQSIFFNGAEASNGYGIILNQEGETSGQLRFLYGQIAWFNTGVFVTDSNWHHVTLVIRTDGHGELYLDGNLAYTGGVLSRITPTNFAEIGRTNHPTLPRYFNGNIDDVAFWNTDLNTTQIRNIFSRQSAKYSGTFLSRAYDAGSSTSWTNLSWKTTLPFFKELVGSTTSETSTHYSAPISASLMSGNLGLWHMSETIAGTAPGSKDLTDSSGSGNHLTKVGTPTFGDFGIFGNAITLNGTNNCFTKGDGISALDNANTATFSAWIKPTSSKAYASVFNRMIDSGAGGCSYAGFDISLRSNNFVVGTTCSCNSRSTLTVNNTIGLNQWIHLLVTYDSSLAPASRFKTYINGVLQNFSSTSNAGTCTANTDVFRQDSNNQLTIGCSDYSNPGAIYESTRYFPGSMDEIGIWNRVLSDTEISQLYRRGSNRVKFQVRSCASPAGCSSSDLTGWKGPDNTNQTYFSELYNSTSNAFLASVLPSGPNMSFSNFSGLGTAMTNRYVQYRAILESDDTSTTCSGTWCSPNVSAVAMVGPNTGYTSGTVATNTPINFVGLSSLTQVLGGGGCSGVPKFLLSPNSTTWYGYSGSAWSNLGAGSYATANTELEVTTNLSSYVSQVGGTSVYLKVFLNSDGTAPCELAALAISGTRTPSAAPTTINSLAWNPAPVMSVAAGATMATFKVQLVDSNGNVITTDNSTQITLSRPQGAGTLGGTLTRTASAGVATFDDITYTKAEFMTIRATAGTKTLDRSFILVSPGVFSLAQSVVTGPSSFNQTVPVAVTLTAKDQFQNANPSGITSVAFTNSGVAGSFSTVVNSGNGVYTANFTPSATGTVTIGATINTTGTVSPNTLTVPVNGPPTQIAVSSGNSQTATVATTLSSPFVAVVRDAGNAIVPSAPVNWAATSGGGSLSSASNVTNASGLSSSTLTLGTTAGTNNNTVNATVAGTAISTSFSASATAGAATQIGFVQNPTSTPLYSYITPAVTVEVKDTYGNRVLTDNSSSIAMALTTGTGALGGTTSKTASSGLATFSDLTVSASGSGKILTASRSGLTSGTSSAFTITDQPFSTTLSFNSSTSSGYTTSGILDFTSTLVESSPLTFGDSAQANFNAGTHTGTVYTGGALQLDQSGTPTNNSELDATWAPQFSSIQGYWKMNESSWNGTANQVIDSSGKGNHGTSGGAANTTASGKFNRAGSFGGQNSGHYVQVPSASSISPSSNLSIQAWVYLTGAQHGGLIWKADFSGAGGTIDYALTFDNSQLTFYLGNGSLSIAQPATGNWVHFVATYDGTTMKIYQNGVLAGSTGRSGTIPTSSNSLILGAYWNSNYSFNGYIDELAIWNTVLSPQEIALIYSRQSAKYSGTFLSRVFDAGSAGTWTGINWASTLPFMKELVGNAASETSSDYSATTASLMSGNVGLWHLNETAGTTGANSVIDSSGNANHGTPTSVVFGGSGKLGTAATFNGSSGGVLISDSSSLAMTGSFTLSAWIYPKSVSGTGIIIERYSADPVDYNLFISLADLATYSNAYCIKTGIIQTKVWQHVAVTYNGSVRTLYYNGIAQTPTDSSGCSSARTSSAASVAIGRRPTSTLVFDGAIDEAGIWNRSLSAAEMLQLYRRGANRVKYQVRTCASAAACSSSDLTGWRGPDDSNQTYFTEFNNNSTVYGTGNVLAASPSFLFSAFSSAPAVTIQNTPRQYAQYRAILESDDISSSCSGTWCSPDVKNVTLTGPSSGYSVGSSSLTTNTPINFVGLSSLTQVLGGGGCSGVPKFMLSPNSTSWYGWSGSAWSNLGAGSYAGANTELEVTTNLSSYVSQVGGTSVYLKVFLNSDGTAPCELAALVLSGTKTPGSDPSVGKTVLSYTGSTQTFTVPAGVTQITMKVWGGGGGTASLNGAPFIGSAGGYTQVTQAVNPGDALTVYVAGGGTGTTAGRTGAGGGGASAVLNGATVYAVAGGGGGMGACGDGTHVDGGGGGGSTGATGRYSTGGGCNGPGAGATQSAAGAGGIGDRRSGSPGSGHNGGNGAGANGVATAGGWGYGIGGSGKLDGNDAGSGGGGGGYFGGGGGGGGYSGTGGGGGSGYFIAGAGNFTNAATGSTVPNSSDPDYVAGVATAGTLSSVHGGNGQVVISWTAPKYLAWNPAPQMAITAGTVMPTFKVQIVNSSGNLLGKDNSTQVTLSRQSGTGTLGGTLTRTVSAGVATFDDITYTKAETMTLRATAGSATLDRSFIAVSAGAVVAAQSAVTGPSSATYNSPITVTLTAKDAGGNSNPTGISTKSFTVSGGTGTFGSISGSNGVFTASFTPTSAGTLTVGALINGSPVGTTLAVSVSSGLTLPSNLLFPIGSGSPPGAQGLTVSFSVSGAGSGTTSLSCVYETVGLSSSDPNYAAPGGNTSCNNLSNLTTAPSGTVVVKSGSNTGVFTQTPGTGSASGSINWTPTSLQRGTYRFIFTVSSDIAGPSGSTYVNVRENYTTSNLVGAYDPLYADVGASSPLTSIPTMPRITANSNNNKTGVFQTLFGSVTGDLTPFGTSAPYQGTGRSSTAAVDPYGLGFVGGSSDSMNLTTVLNSFSRFASNAWVKPSSPSTAGTVIASNGGGSGNGFVLRQSTYPPGRAELAVGSKFYSYRDLVLSDKPVGYWRLGESSGTTAADISATGSNGTYSGTFTPNQTGALTGSGDADKSVLFSSGGGHVSIPYSSSYGITTGDFSIELWFYDTMSSGTRGDLFSWKNTDNNDFGIFIQTDNTLKVWMAINGSGSLVNGYAPTPTKNQWNHLVFTRNSSVTTLYLNGTPAGTSGSFSASLANLASIPMWIGANCGGSNICTTATDGAPFKGYLDDFSFYTYALSATQIANHYNTGVSSNYLPYPGNAILADKPVGYWRLGEKSGTTAYDFSGGGNDGTYTGGYTLNQTGALGSSDSDTAVTFNGSTGYVNSYGSDAAPSTSTNVWSAEARVKRATNSATGPIIEATNYVLAVGVSPCSTNQIKVTKYQVSDLCIGSFPADTNWHHLAAVYNGTSVTAYVDGVLNASTATSANFTGSSGARRIAIDKDGVLLTGSLDEVAVFNYPLSSTQVLSHYNSSNWWTCQSQSALSSSNWNLLSTLYDGTTAQLFVNGRSECSVTPGTTYSSTVASTTFGSTPATRTNFWSGVLGFLDFFGTTSGAPASATTVKADFDATANRFRQKPIENSVTSNLVINLDPANANAGLAPFSNGCASSDLNWFDLSSNAWITALMNFSSCGASSGWVGDGSVSNPHSLAFDGTNDYVSYPDSTSYAATSLVGWFYPAGIPTVSYYSLLSRDGWAAGYIHTLFRPDRRLVFAINGGTPASDFVSTAALSLNTWHHVALVYDSAAKTIKFYINGVLDSTATYTAAPAGAWGPGRFGSWNGEQRTWLGKIGPLKVYSRALSTSEVKQNCLAEEARFTSTPQGICGAP